MSITIKRAAAVGIVGAALVTGGGIAIAATDGTDAQAQQGEQDRRGPGGERQDRGRPGPPGDRGGRGWGRGGQDCGPGGPGRGRPGGPFGGPAVFAAGVREAARVLDLTPRELRQRLRAGDSLADVAEAEGVERADLKAALERFARERLAEAVDAGRLEQSDADRIADGLSERLDAIIDGERLGLGPWGGPGGHGPGGPGGRGPGGPGDSDDPPPAPSTTPTP